MLAASLTLSGLTMTSCTANLDNPTIPEPAPEPDPEPDPEPEPEPEEQIQPPEGWEIIENKKVIRIYYTEEVLKSRNLEGATGKNHTLEVGSLSDYNFEMQDVKIQYVDDSGITRVLNIAKATIGTMIISNNKQTIYVDHDCLFVLSNKRVHKIPLDNVKSIIMNGEELVNTNVLQIANKINYFCDHTGGDVGLVPNVHEVTSDYPCVTSDGYYIETLEQTNFTTEKNNNKEKYGDGDYLLKMNIGTETNPNIIIIGSYNEYDLLKNNDDYVAYYDRNTKQAVNLTNETYSNIEKLDNKYWTKNIYESDYNIDQIDTYRSDEASHDNSITHWISGPDRNGQGLYFTIFNLETKGQNNKNI